MPLCCRKSENALLLQKHPDKVALIVERYRKERRIRDVDRCQFLVPKTATVGQLQHILRERFCEGNMSIFILVNDELPAATTTLEVLSQRHRDEDGFLYVSVSTEEFLG
ncbi:GABA(A) receptor-associated protein (autophagy-related protein 8) [Aphelenchoides avenae]|nr:GABA(A) receptor-associated protein (autophagy-related protein 8) [Aphelenchus avenae]